MATYLHHHVDVLDALGDETRRNIVDMLTDRPHGVRELADKLPVTRPAVSQHLKILKTAGLVGDEAVGTRRIYSVRSSGFEPLRDYLDSMWGAGLASFAAAAEKAAATIKEQS